MQIVVTHHYHLQDSPQGATYEGTEEDCRRAILHAYPWLARKFGLHAKLQVLLHALDSSQAYSVADNTGDVVIKASAEEAGVGADVVGSMLGHDLEFNKLLDAAKFLSGAEPDGAAVRAARVATPDDITAALLACGLDSNWRSALLAVLEAVSVQKSEVELEPNQELKMPEEVVAVTPDGQGFADAVKKAAEQDQVYPLKLGGKHSKGSMLAYVPEDHTRILLKPGSGPQNPASGDREDSASQSKREAAFYAVAKSWGLHESFPETHLLHIDGKEFAAMKLLSFDFKNMNSVKAEDPNGPRRIFQLYRSSGLLHRWAAIDFVLGNPDRNAGNVMSRGGDVVLIDHGSSMAGLHFDPANDRNSFVPFYIRALAPHDFDNLPTSEKLRQMPRASSKVESELQTWLLSLDEGELTKNLTRFGVDPQPAVIRLKKLKEACGHQPADLAVLSAWVM
jgi:hypothetical protein